MANRFEKLPVFTLADAKQEARCEAFIAVISKLPEAVRGTAPNLLFEIVANWMHAAAAKQLSASVTRCDVSPPDAHPAARWDSFLAAQLKSFFGAFDEARGIIRAVLAALRSADPDPKRYVTRVIKAADKRTMLYSDGSGKKQTAAQPWLPSPDHVLAAARAETHASTPEQHRDAASRVRAAVLMLAGVIPAVADDGTALTDEDKVDAAAALVSDVQRLRSRQPRGTRPTADAGFHIARAVCDYRNRQDLPVATPDGHNGAWEPTADTIALAVAVAAAWSVDITPRKLGRQLRRHLKRLMDHPEHGQRADAEHIDFYGLGFTPPE